MPLPRSFYTRPVLELARDLLGAELVHVTDDGTVSGLIVEVEAYRGPEDRAAHSYGGRRTERTEVMFGDGGHAYVFQIYGIHYCFNVVASVPGRPEAVLIRALEPLTGLSHMARRRQADLDARCERWLRERQQQFAQAGNPSPLITANLPPPPPILRRLTDGPGKLCQALAIDRSCNGYDLTAGSLFLRRGAQPLPESAIARGPRINVDYAGQWAQKPWRFWVRGNPFVSVSAQPAGDHPDSQQGKGC